MYPKKCKMSFIIFFTLTFVIRDYDVSQVTLIEHVILHVDQY
jgi:hypothetical protein